MGEVHNCYFEVDEEAPEFLLLQCTYIVEKPDGNIKEDIPVEDILTNGDYITGTILADMVAEVLNLPVKWVHNFEGHSEQIELHVEIE
ncbi:MAG: hypothetical protein ACOCQR_03600 [bacterium]